MVKSLQAVLRGSALVLAATLVLPVATTYAQKKRPADAPTPAEIRAEKKGMQPGGYYGPQPAVESIDLSMYERIRTEGMTHGKAMEFASALCDGIGPRLTGSPNMKKANEWTREALTKIGLENAHLEDWGEFGMGWYQINTWGRIVRPDPEPIWMQAAPWSSATNGAISGEIVYVPLTDASQLDAFKGMLKGKIVLLGAMRRVVDLDQPLSFRYTDEELKELEGDQAPRRLTGPPPDTPQLLAHRQLIASLRQRAVRMMQEEGVAAILLPSRDNGRNGGTGIIFDDNTMNLVRRAQLRENVVPIPYAIVMIEHYNRLARLAQAQVPVTVEVNIQTAFTGDHEHGFNTVAEIPGTDPDLKDQVVMAGGHLDSWISGTGATDNGAGSVVAMEAIRILKALDVKPKRTIRIALWSGEEQGLFGSKGYVDQHFGKFAASTDPAPAGAPALMGDARGPLHTTKEWEKLDAYYNIDEGGGKVRGIYTQGNYAIAPIFAHWIAPLKDLGVSCITTRNDIGSDHQSFDAVGLPGFEFIQDELDYETRTHHSNMDTVDHLHGDDLEQAAIVEAIFLWNTSEREAMMPRKAFPHPEIEKQRNAPIPGLFPGATGSGR